MRPRDRATRWSPPRKRPRGCVAVDDTAERKWGHCCGRGRGSPAWALQGCGAAAVDEATRWLRDRRLWNRLWKGGGLITPGRDQDGWPQGLPCGGGRGPASSSPESQPSGTGGKAAGWGGSGGEGLLVGRASLGGKTVVTGPARGQGHRVLATGPGHGRGSRAAVDEAVGPSLGRPGLVGRRTAALPPSQSWARLQRRLRGRYHIPWPRYVGEAPEWPRRGPLS